MSNLHIVTGYRGQAHVSASDNGALNAAIFGSGEYVLGKGSKFAASVISNNQIRIADGDIMMQGRHIRLNEGSYVDLTIENGSQNTYRNDLIVARYTKDSVTGVEDCNLVVIKGTEVASNPVDPAYTTGDIIEDHDLQNDMLLYRVPLIGLNVQALECLFTTATESFRDMSDKQNNTNSLTAENNLADADVFPFFDVSATSNRKTTWQNIKSKLETVFNTKFAAKTHASTHATGGADAITPAFIGAEKSKLLFLSASVGTHAFVSDSSFGDYPYRANVALTGVTADMIPEVVFSLADATSGNYAPVAVCYNGGVRIYATAIPESTLTIPTIYCWKGVS